MVETVIVETLKVATLKVLPTLRNASKRERTVRN